MYKEHLCKYLESNGYKRHQIFGNVFIKGVQIESRTFISISDNKIYFKKEIGNGVTELIFDIRKSENIFTEEEIYKNAIIKLKDYFNTINRKSRIEKLKL